MRVHAWTCHAGAEARVALHRRGHLHQLTALGEHLLDTRPLAKRLVTTDEFDLEPHLAGQELDLLTGMLALFRARPDRRVGKRPCWNQSNFPTAVLATESVPNGVLERMAVRLAVARTNNWQ